MTAKERYELCEEALKLIRKAGLDMDNGPADVLMDYMDDIWKESLSE